MVFGRDIIQIPCFRDSLLNGIYSGLATLVLTLMATSKPKLATDVGLGIFCAGTLASFAYCRYQRDKTRQLVKDAQLKISRSTEDKVQEP